MTLYLTASTPVRKVFIDFIEVLLCDGRVVSLNWDESGIDWTEDGFSARYKGICFDEEYANGKMEQLQGLKVTAVGLYSESAQSGDFTIEEMVFVLVSAMAGNHEALEVLLKLYEPLINKHCYIDGVLDEDLRQYILVHIALTISKFPL